MIQTVIMDVTQPSTSSYVPPDHRAGERWPGRDLRALRQRTLFEAATAAVEEGDDDDRETPGSPSPHATAARGRGAREACGVCAATAAQHADTRVMLGSGHDVTVPIVAMTVPFSVAVGQADPPPPTDPIDCALLRDRINERIRNIAKMRARAIAKRRLGA